MKSAWTCTQGGLTIKVYTLEFQISWKVSQLSCKISSQISGEISQISGEWSQISGKMSQTSGKMSQISGKMSQIIGKTSQISGKMSQISGKMCQISGEITQISCKISKISRKTFQLWTLNFELRVHFDGENAQCDLKQIGIFYCFGKCQNWLFIVEMRQKSWLGWIYLTVKKQFTQSVLVFLSLVKTPWNAQNIYFLLFRWFLFRVKKDLWQIGQFSGSFNFQQIATVGYQQKATLIFHTQTHKWQLKMPSNFKMR